MPCDIPGHQHDWPTEGTLYITKCERICAYCVEAGEPPKLWQYAWFLRRHVRTCKHRNTSKRFKVSNEWRQYPPEDSPASQADSPRHGSSLETIFEESDAAAAASQSNMTTAHGAASAPRQRANSSRRFATTSYTTSATSRGTASTSRKRNSPTIPDESPIKRARRTKREETPETQISQDFDRTTDSENDADDHDAGSFSDFIPHATPAISGAEDANIDDAGSSSDLIPHASLAAPPTKGLNNMSISTPASKKVSIADLINIAEPRPVQVYSARYSTFFTESTPSTPRLTNAVLSGTPSSVADELADLRLRLRHIGIDPDDLPNHTVNLIPARVEDTDPAVQHPDESFEAAMIRFHAHEVQRISFSDALQTIQHQGLRAGLSNHEMGIITAAHVERLFAQASEDAGEDLPDRPRTPSRQASPTMDEAHDLPTHGTRSRATSDASTIAHPAVPNNTPLDSPRFGGLPFALPRETRRLLERFQDNERFPSQATTLVNGEDHDEAPPPYSEIDTGMAGYAHHIIQGIMDGRHNGNLTHLAGIDHGLYGPTDHLRLAALQETLAGNFFAEDPSLGAAATSTGEEMAEGQGGSLEEFVDSSGWASGE
ncbi:Hypothetical protein D9617_11g008050 [Elsinoe fawcettii]|nr:Hypothetical protein D9617_11g008050 [Elsinoe fawcettii]